MGKGQPAGPEAGFTQLSESLTPTQTTPSLKPHAGHQPRPVEGPGDPTVSLLQGDRQHGLKGRCSDLFIELFPFHFTCHAQLVTCPVTPHLIPGV